jgi:hypothetical protein
MVRKISESFVFPIEPVPVKFLYDFYEILAFQKSPKDQGFPPNKQQSSCIRAISAGTYI